MCVLCVGVHMHMDALVSVCICVCACGDQRLTSGILPQVSPTLFYEAGSLTWPETHQLG